jgi:hypothetical protein
MIAWGVVLAALLPESPAWALMLLGVLLVWSAVGCHPRLWRRT